MVNSKEILTIHSDDVSDNNDIPFDIFPLGAHCMDNDPHRHTFYEILYLTSGEGYHIIDSEPHRIKTPIFYFISPGQVHFWELTKVFEGHFLMFNEDFLVFPSSGLNSIEEVTFFYTVGESPELSLNTEQALQINELLHSIEDEYRVKEANRASVLRAYLHILITRLQRFSNGNKNENKSAGHSSMVRKFKHLVSENFLKNLSVQDYADKIGISVSHLSNTLKTMTGLTPAQIIHNEVLLEAKRLLIHTDLTVSEAGYQLSFEDPSYFSRFFKRETGLSPKQFRINIREKYQRFTE